MIIDAILGFMADFCGHDRSRRCGLLGGHARLNQCNEEPEKVSGFAFFSPFGASRFGGGCEGGQRGLWVVWTERIIETMFDLPDLRHPQ